MNVLVSVLGGRTINIFIPFDKNGKSTRQSWLTVSQIKTAIQDREGIPSIIQRLTYQTKELRDSTLKSFQSSEANFTPLINLSLCLLGGKGGFGALLRGAGSKGKKTTNFDDCRDLNGRRIRNVKNEQKLMEWYQQQQQKELEEKEKKNKPKEEYKHANTFDSTSYRKEMQEINDEIADSVEEGLKREKELKEQAKRKRDDSVSKTEKKKSKFLLEGLEGLVDFSDSEDDSNNNNSNASEKVSDRKRKSNEEEVSNGDDLNADAQDEDNNTSSTTSSEKKTYYNSRLEEKSNHTTLATLDKVAESPLNLDLQDYESAKDLEKIGLDSLKTELQLRGLMIGGNLQQRAERLFSVKGKSISQVDPKLFAKVKLGNGNTPLSKKSKNK